MAGAQTITVIGSDDPNLAMDLVTLDRGKTLDLTHGIGSAAFRRADLMLINDNDFGITGATTRIARVGGLSVRP